MTARPWIDYLATLGDQPGDDQELRLRLRFMIATAVAMGTGGLIWGALALVLGLTWQSAIPLSYTAITIANLAVLKVTKRFPRARTVQVLISVVLPFLLQWGLGGFVASGCIMIWALLSLTASMSFGGLRSSLVWLSVFLVLMAVSIAIDPYLTVPAPMVNPQVTMAAFAVNVSSVAVALFVLITAFLHLRHQSSVQLAERNRQLAESQQALVQSEKMAALGRLSAGMAHELNNPASAAQRGASHLSNAIDRLRRVSYGLGAAGLDPRQLERLRALDDHAEALVREPLTMDSMRRMELEEEIQAWLERRLPDADLDAAVLGDLGFDEGSLEELRGLFGEATLPLVLARVTCSHTITALLGEIGEGAGRIVTIVNALKSYTYLDQAPVQAVDVHDGLDNTLVMLGGLLKKGVTVKREYDRTLPPITVHGGELNQVWTNLIDNAVAAMEGKGELVVRSRRDGDAAAVDIIDSGPGIPSNIIGRVFDPFVTTKPVGEGTGLGLNICRNIVVEKHGGTISVDSVPGRTRFTVRLPLTA